MSTWEVVLVAAVSSIVTTLTLRAVDAWRYRPRPISPEVWEATGDAFRAGLRATREPTDRG